MSNPRTNTQRVTKVKINSGRYFLFQRKPEVDPSVIATLDCAYAMHGHVRDVKGTLCAEGFVQFKSCKTLSAVQRKLPGYAVRMERIRADGILYIRMHSPGYQSWGTCPLNKGEEVYMANMLHNPRKFPYDQALSGYQRGALPGILVREHALALKKVTEYVIEEGRSPDEGRSPEKETKD